jgi:hypothetical protein
MIGFYSEEEYTIKNLVGNLKHNHEKQFLSLPLQAEEGDREKAET